MLPAFTCGQYGECSEYDGQCKCPSGWAGIDCLIPRMYLPNTLYAADPLTRHMNIECDSLADGEHRRPRDGDTPCECKDGWGGINCNGRY